MAMSNSAAAVLWLQNNPGATQAEAAQKHGIKASTLSHALAKRATESYCPCCGQTMKVGAKPGRKSK
jgi:DNA-binding transcriptional regulator LsrR (DeoR family)